MLGDKTKGQSLSTRTHAELTEAIQKLHAEGQPLPAREEMVETLKARDPAELSKRHMLFVMEEMKISKGKGKSCTDLRDKFTRLVARTKLIIDEPPALIPPTPEQILRGESSTNFAKLALGVTRMNIVESVSGDRDRGLDMLRGKSLVMTMEPALCISRTALFLTMFRGVGAMLITSENDTNVRWDWGGLTRSTVVEPIQVAYIRSKVLNISDTTDNTEARLIATRVNSQRNQWLGNQEMLEVPSVADLRRLPELPFYSAREMELVANHVSRNMFLGGSSRENLGEPFPVLTPAGATSVSRHYQAYPVACVGLRTVVPCNFEAKYTRQWYDWEFQNLMMPLFAHEYVDVVQSFKILKQHKALPEGAMCLPEPPHPIYGLRPSPVFGGDDTNYNTFGGVVTLQQIFYYYTAQLGNGSLWSQRVGKYFTPLDECLDEFVLSPLLSACERKEKELREALTSNTPRLLVKFEAQLTTMHDLWKSNCAVLKSALAQDVSWTDERPFEEVHALYYGPNPALGADGRLKTAVFKEGDPEWAASRSHPVSFMRVQRMHKRASNEALFEKHQDQIRAIVEKVIGHPL